MMKEFIPCILIFLLFFSCKKEITGIENSLNQLSLLTDQISYTNVDSINLNIENKSAFDMVIGLRCGVYLEMYYQKEENNVWSDNLFFGYMSLHCPTFLDTIPTNNTFAHSIQSEIFESTGTFRFLVPYYLPRKDTNMVAVSNSFEIKRVKIVQE